MDIIRKKKLSIFSVLLAFFVDTLGWSIVFPIFAPLFLDPNHLIFSPSVSISTRTTMLGLFLAAFPLAQFFGAPILGELSDSKGRKKALLLSLFFVSVGYLISAISIMEKNLVLLFVSRIVTGLFSGNLAVCMAAIADVSTTRKEKVKYFGYLSILAGFSFIVGSLIGGNFSDKKLNAFFHPSLPFWIACALSFLNFLILWRFFVETVTPHKKGKYSLLEGLILIKQAVSRKGLQYIYLAFFFFIIGWTILFQFTPVLVIEKFHFTNAQIGNTAAFMGVCWMLGAFISSAVVGDKNLFGKTLLVLLFLFTLFVFLVIFPTKVSYVFLLLAGSMFITGMAWPYFSGMVSDIAPQRIQGKILGISQSIQSLAMGVSPILGGLADNVSQSFPFAFASICSLIAALVFFFYKTKYLERSN